MDTLSWKLVVDQEAQPLEFGACHEHYAWRRHTNRVHKFMSLGAAFASLKDSVTDLLTNPLGNRQAKAHPERGRVLFAAVWYEGHEWAVLCDQRVAVLVGAVDLEAIPVTKAHDAEIEVHLRRLVDDAPEANRKPLAQMKHMVAESLTQQLS